MKCSTCDSVLEPGSAFCANCGMRVVTSNPGAPVSAIPASETWPNDTSPSYEAQQYPPYVPAQPPPQPQYISSQYATPSFPMTAPTSTAATVSLIFGILCWVVLPLAGAIVAIVAGHIARNQIRTSNNQMSGAGQALIGLILGYTQVVISVLGCLVFALLIIIGANVDR